jgi:amyloid beta precursor protein binding protein 1
MADAGVDRKRRYDRQLRIWGEQGQSRLESARVCLLHCGPTGTEALKSLVLGGIASFTLVDGGKVTPADLGNKCVARAVLLRARARAPPQRRRSTPPSSAAAVERPAYAPACSFLVQASALGTPRAACVAALLKELNDAVAGAYVEEEPAQLLASDPAFFKDFTLVIATQARGSGPRSQRARKGACGNPGPRR